MDRKKKKKIIGITTVAMGATFVGLSYFAKKKKPDSIYENDPNQKNPLEGKRVIFVEDEKDKENADGVKGHLVEIGDSLYRPSFYEKYIKRGMDVILSFGGLVVLSPIMGTIALAIKLEDPGPVLFTQKRLGQNKQYFKLHKFRSMKMSTPHDVPTHMLDNPDQYITKVGKFIRAHSLDELPQIWDIFVGNMSVIGPRPGLWNQDLLTAERDKYSANDVKPGLTGWAQINGRDELEIPDKAKLDGEYVKNMGAKMDAKVFLGSLHVFGKDDSVVEGGTGTMNKNEVEEVYTESEKFSVLMSVYSKENAEFFDLSLNGILNKQTRKPDEFVLVCDGPLTKELDTVVDKYKSAYPDVFKVYRTEQNQGLGKALNYGLSKCTYDIVLRADSDDICVENRFAIQVGFMEKHPDIAVCSSYIDEFDTDWNKPEKKKELPLTNKELYEMAKFRNPINHMAAGFRKNIILEIGSYHHIPYVEDYELWVRTLIHGYKLANIDQVLVHARVGNGMVKRRGNKEYIKSWKQLSQYMLTNHMINHSLYVRNIIAVTTFVYMPGNIKEIIYKTLLRK
jgi:lipopolysaccharide/colanic/teichoic acid biosynthesis glycosyltransferase/glycosyltransferase involved in cell wall biosynthesis